jgi:hypothetical protein
MSIASPLMLVLLAMIGTGQPAEVPAGPTDTDLMAPDPGVTLMEGPTLVCGEAFALRLVAGERARYQEGPDFQVFTVESANGPFVIYEGNYPEPGAQVIRTGRTFPALVALHYRPDIDARSQRRTRARIVTGTRMTRLCSQQATRRP